VTPAACRPCAHRARGDVSAPPDHARRILRTRGVELFHYANAAAFDAKAHASRGFLVAQSTFACAVWAHLRRAFRWTLGARSAAGTSLVHLQILCGMHVAEVDVWVHEIHGCHPARDVWGRRALPTITLSRPHTPGQADAPCGLSPRNCL
jgi:hypothetical protein